MFFPFGEGKKPQKKYNGRETEKIGENSGEKKY